MDSLIQIDDKEIVLVFCCDSETTEHMTWKQYQNNGNSILVGPQWIIDSIGKSNNGRI